MKCKATGGKKREAILTLHDLENNILKSLKNLNLMRGNKPLYLTKIIEENLVIRMSQVPISRKDLGNPWEMNMENYVLFLFLFPGAHLKKNITTV